MTFGIAIDRAAWQRHTDAFVESVHGVGAAVIPVIKGDGYGLSASVLAAEATRLGVRAVAAGTVFEAEALLTVFAGDVLVLEPVEVADREVTQVWSRISSSPDSARVIRTVASQQALEHVIREHGPVRVVIEAQTAMRRFGCDPVLLRETWDRAVLAESMGALRVLGVTLHLPLASDSADIDMMLQLVEALGAEQPHLLVSHLSVRQVEILRRHHPDLRVSLRVGTALWLGDRRALGAFGTVQAVHRVTRGVTVGYGRTRTRGSGHVIVVSGGTAHGVGLAAPVRVTTTRQRITAITLGLLQAIGRTKSPFVHDGRELWFVEPPHQHVSMLWLPDGIRPPTVGDRLSASVRFTTTHADTVELH